MTSAELITFLNEDAEESANARTLANIARRAATLWANGYKFSNVLHLFFVLPPKGGCYTVELPNPFADDPSCTCPCFAKRKTCKHLLAVQAMVWEQENAEEAALLAEHEQAEACREFYADNAELHGMKH